MPPHLNSSARVCSIVFKNFRSYLQKNNHNDSFQVFQLISANNLAKPTSSNTPKLSAEIQFQLEKVLKERHAAFRDDLRRGQPPKCDVVHEIVLTACTKPTNHPLLQFSLAELIVIREYMTDPFKKGKIWRIKSPFGAPLILLNRNGKCED